MIKYKVEPKLSAVLSEKGMTQMELANLSGVPQSAISRFDKTASHKDEHIVAICKALNITYFDLFNVSKI